MNPEKLADELERINPLALDREGLKQLAGLVLMNKTALIKCLRSQSQPDNSGGGGEDVTNAKAGESTTLNSIRRKFAEGKYFRDSKAAVHYLLDYSASLLEQNVALDIALAAMTKDRDDQIGRLLAANERNDDSLTP